MKNKVLAVVVAMEVLFSVATKAQTLIGITNANSIFTMSNVTAPSTVGGPYAVSGVTGGQVLVGIDVRPSTGEVYALGYDSVSMTSQLYKITNSGSTYTATGVGGSTSAINLGATNSAAVDFIATADNQIRVVARNGNNYVINATTGAVLSTGGSSMSFAVGDIYAGLSNAIAATAYTNSFLGADATNEVGYDAVNNVLVKFDAGTFANGFNNTSYTVHSIGIGTGLTLLPLSYVGMDTWYDSLSHSNTIFLSGATLLGGTHLYKYDLSGTTGTLIDLGTIGSGSMIVRDIAFNMPGASTAPVTGSLMTALSLNMRNLITFDSRLPGAIRSVKALSGIAAGQRMIALDYSLSGMLYGLGYNSTAQTYQLYMIDTATANVTAVNTTPHNLFLGTDDGSGNRINASFRFIPTLANTIRVIGSNGTVNATIDATTGNIVTTDAALSYVTGDVSYGAAANLTSAAYTGYSMDASTQMYGFDENNGTLVMFDATNGTGGLGNGASGYISSDMSLNTVLSLLGHSSTYNNAYVDIVYDPAISTNIGYIAANYIGDSSDQLNYSVLYDMSAMLAGSHKGTATTPTNMGNIGFGTPVKDAVIYRSPYTNTTGIAGIQGTPVNDLLVYPNPVYNTTHIILPVAPYASVHVYIVDMNGAVDRNYSYDPGTYNLEVDMSTLPAGLYSIRVSGKGINDHNLKVVKTN